MPPRCAQLQHTDTNSFQQMHCTHIYVELGRFSFRPNGTQTGTALYPPLLRFEAGRAVAQGCSGEGFGEGEGEGCGHSRSMMLLKLSALSDCCRAGDIRCPGRGTGNGTPRIGAVAPVHELDLSKYVDGLGFLGSQTVQV